MKVADALYNTCILLKKPKAWTKIYINPQTLKSGISVVSNLFFLFSSIWNPYPILYYVNILVLIMFLIFKLTAGMLKVHFNTVIYYFTKYDCQLYLNALLAY